MMKNNAASPREKRRERERQQRRHAIIQVALRFFADQGYDETMVDRIADAAGYTKMTIYNYFDSKDDLFVAVVSEAYQKLYDIMKTHLNQDDVRYELRSMGDAYLIFFERHPSEARLFEIGRLGIVISKMLEKEKVGTQLTESEQEFRTRMGLIEELMTSVITETMRESGVQDKVDPFSVIMVLSTFAQTIRELVLRGKRTDQPEERTREYLSVFFTIIDQGLRHYDD